MEKKGKRSSGITEQTKTTRTKRLIRGVFGVGGISAQVKEMLKLSADGTSNVVTTRFYDDSPDNISDVQEDLRIECILVPRITTGPRGADDEGTADEYIRYIEKEGGWDLDGEDSDLKDVLNRFRKDGTAEDNISDSLTEESMEDLRRWVMSNENAKCVIFDFDRVINRVEGVVGYDTEEEIRQIGITAAGLAKYHMGTKRRKRAFKRLLNDLIRRCIHIHIVTNNTAAGCELFYKIVKHIHPVFTKATVHGSYDHDTKLLCIRELKLV